MFEQSNAIKMTIKHKTKEGFGTLGTVSRLEGWFSERVHPNVLLCQMYVSQ